MICIELWPARGRIPVFMGEQRIGKKSRAKQLRRYDIAQLRPLSWREPGRDQEEGGGVGLSYSDEFIYFAADLFFYT